MSQRVRVMAALCATGLVAMQASGAAAVAPRTTLPTIERQVMCVTCKIPLNVAESPQADEEREFIQELIDRGQTEAQIKRSLVVQYGQSVLALPSTHGFALAAYLVPILVVVLLAGTLAFLLPSWRRRARERNSASPTREPSLSPAQSALLEQDMARYDP